MPFKPHAGPEDYAGDKEADPERVGRMQVEYLQGRWPGLIRALEDRGASWKDLRSAALEDGGASLRDFRSAALEDGGASLRDFRSASLEDWRSAACGGLKEEGEKMGATVDGKTWVGSDSALGRQVGGNHYIGFAVQPVEFITRNNLSFLQGCIIKRICRYRSQGGKGREDLEKAVHEIQLLMELDGPGR